MIDHSHPAGAVAAIERIFASARSLDYLGERVTMAEHQLQAAALADAAGAPEAVVVAALLHDVGHLIDPAPGVRDAADAIEDDTDGHHEAIGARWLSRWFRPDVTGPVRLHVAAKRYLVATEPGYASRLSPASVHTLALQGGPMRPTEAAAFEGLRHGADAIALRRFDEAAKDPTAQAPALECYLERLGRLARGPGG
jgi:gamma-butyrobetaine dioxygenase